MTLDEYNALREVESAVCPECGRVACSRDNVWTCGEHTPPVVWRWPGVVGMD